MTTVRIAIFGNGFARSVVLPALRHVEGAEVVGIASPTASRVEATAKEYGIGRWSTDHREILESTAPNLVFVVTPPHRHLDQSVDALEAGCHVVCEKPTAMDADESLAMLEAARAHPDRITLIDHELRVDPRRLQLRRWLEEGRFGEILHAHYTVLSPSLRDASRPWGWWFDGACGGGTLGALGSHAVDSLRWLIGEVTSVRGLLHTFTTERPDPAGEDPREVTVDDFASAWLGFENGARGTITLSTVDGEREHRVRISGRDGAACLDEQGALRASFDGGPLQEVAVDDDLPTNSELRIPDTDWARSFVRFSRKIVAAIERGEAEVPGAATFEDGHRTQQVLDAIRRSHAEERPVAPGA